MDNAETDGRNGLSMLNKDKNMTGNPGKMTKIPTKAIVSVKKKD